VQQVFGPDPRLGIGDEQAEQPVREHIAQQHQRTGQPQVDGQPGAQDRPDAFEFARANRLRPEDRGRNRNRQRRELHVIDDLRHRAVGRRGLRAVAVDQGQNHQLRQRQHHHLHPGR
jgi:hypothetical protein